MSTPVRRVVTGRDAKGKSTIAVDGQPSVVVTVPALPGTVFTEIWQTKTSPVVVDNGADPTDRSVGIGPGPNGSVVRIVDLPPEGPEGPVMDREAVKAAFEALGSSHNSTWKEGSPHPMMHRTETLDYGIVLFGEVHLILDDREVQLFPGDVVVQRGTNHMWSNRTDKPARMIFILLDGIFAPELKQH